MQKLFYLTVDVKDVVSNFDIELINWDTGNVFLIEVLDDSAPVNLAGTDITAVFAKPGAPGPVAQDMETGVSVTDAPGGKLRINLRTGSFTSEREGRVQAELILKKDKLITSARFSFSVKNPILTPLSIQATDEFPVLDRLITDVREVEQRTDAAGVYASGQGDYAKAQGDRAKEQADGIAKRAAEGGFSASVTLGSVITLEPEENAYIVNDGNVKDAVLSFGIPKGRPGKGQMNSINGLYPDANGNFECTAEKVGAIPIGQKGAASGVATLNANGQVIQKPAPGGSGAGTPITLTDGITGGLWYWKYGDVVGVHGILRLPSDNIIMASAPWLPVGFRPPYNTYGGIEGLIYGNDVKLTLRRTLIQYNGLFIFYPPENPSDPYVAYSLHTTFIAG